ncbi:MAG: hypothetical protein R2795_04030 [Saprospiraceae bacterium]
MLLVGGVLVYFGASYTIYAITNVRHHHSIPPKLIALTAVTIGTICRK